MAITAGNATFVGTGPSQSGQILADGNLPGSLARALFGQCSVTGDGASATFDCNYIDGTKTISFTPTNIICSRSGGAATGTISVVSCIPKSGSENKAFTVVTSANVNAATFVLTFVALP